MALYDPQAVHDMSQSENLSIFTLIGFMTCVVTMLYQVGAIPVIFTFFFEVQL